MRPELDRVRVELVLDGTGTLLRVEKDWFFAWPIFGRGCSDRGEEKIVDFGRLMLDIGPGEGDAEFLMKGLFRHFGPF